jgi:ParB-like chromosome segregation protein Spo0J
MPGTVERTTLPITDLVAFEGNPRKITDAAKEGLKTSIERFGLVQEVVVNRRTMNVVGGHQRLEALQEMGETEVPVALVDLDDDAERALNIALNNPKLQGEFTADLNVLLSEIGDKTVLDGLHADGLAESLTKKLKQAEEDAQREFEIDAVHVAPPPKMVWALVSLPADRAHELSPHLDAISRIDGVKCDQVIR